MWLIVSKPTQLMGVSRMLESKDGPHWGRLALYTTHLALGDSWNQVFFGCQRVGLGAIVIGIFWDMLAISSWAFYQVDPKAGILLLPTQAWVTVATALNLSIYKLNKK